MRQMGLKPSPNSAWKVKKSLGLQLGSINPEWCSLFLPIYPPNRQFLFSIHMRKLYQAWPWSLFCLVFVLCILLHKDSGIHSPSWLTPFRIPPIGYQEAFWDPICSPFTSQRRDLDVAPTQDRSISSNWAEHGTKMILLRCFYQKQELGAVSRWQMSILLTDSQALCWLLTERQTWLGFFLPSQNLTPPVYVNTPLPIHLLKSKF